jgi:hypothetical protein
VVLFSYEYQDNVGTTYLSSEEDNPTCKTPVKTFSGTYYLSSSGVWSTYRAFDAREVRLDVMRSEEVMISWDETHGKGIQEATLPLDLAYSPNTWLQVTFARE